MLIMEKPESHTSSAEENDSKPSAKPNEEEEAGSAPSSPERKIANRVSVLSEGSAGSNVKRGAEEAEEEDEETPKRKKKRRRKEDKKPGLQERWDEMFLRLVAFKKREGHCLVPNRFAEDPSLGAWVSTQRRQYKVLISGSSESTPMTPERATRLMSIGFVWATKDPRHVPWETRFRELCDFKKKYGHCLVPIGYKGNVPLSNWVSTQRQEFKLLREGRTSRMTEDRIQALDAIGFVWEAQRGGPRKKTTLRVVNDDDTPSIEGDMVLARQAGRSMTTVSSRGASAPFAPGSRPPLPRGPQRERAARAAAAAFSGNEDAASAAQLNFAAGARAMAAASANQDAARAAQMNFAAGARAAEQAMMMRALSHEQALMRQAAGPAAHMLGMAPTSMPAMQPVMVPVPVQVPVAGHQMLCPPGYAGMPMAGMSVAPGMPNAGMLQGGLPVAGMPAAPTGSAIWQREQAFGRLVPPGGPGYPIPGSFPPGTAGPPRRRSSRSEMLEGGSPSKRRRLSDGVLDARARGGRSVGDSGRRHSAEISTSLIRQVAAQLGEDHNELVERSKMHGKRCAANRQLPRTNEEAMAQLELAMMEGKLSPKNGEEGKLGKKK